MLKKLLVTALFLIPLGVLAAPTTTILLRPQIPSLGSTGNPCLTVGTAATLGLVSTSTCGAGGATTTINSVSGPTFTFASTSPIGINISGTTFTWTCTTCVVTTTGNWQGTWQLYNPSDFITSSTPTGTNFATGTPDQIVVFNATNTGAGYAGFTFDNSTALFSAPSGTFAGGLTVNGTINAAGNLVTTNQVKANGTSLTLTSGGDSIILNSGTGNITFPVGFTTTIGQSGSAVQITNGGTFKITALDDALMLTNASGQFTKYGGFDCGAGNFARTLSASGTVTCAADQSGSGGVATSSLGDYAIGNIAFFINSSTISASSSIKMNSSTGLFEVYGIASTTQLRYQSSTGVTSSLTSLIIGGDTIQDFTGTGLGMTGNTLTNTGVLSNNSITGATIFAGTNPITISSSSQTITIACATCLTTSSASATITTAGFTFTTPFTFTTSTGIGITSSSGNINFSNTGITSINGTTGAYNIYPGGLLTIATGTGSSTISFASSSLGLGTASVFASTDFVASTTKIGNMFISPTSSIATNSIAFFPTGATSTASSTNNLFWDRTNSFLGVGTSAPATVFEVVGSSTQPTIIGGNINGTSNLDLWAFPTGTDPFADTGKIRMHSLVEFPDQITVSTNTITNAVILRSGTTTFPLGANILPLLLDQSTLLVNAQQSLSAAPTFYANNTIKLAAGLNDNFVHWTGFLMQTNFNPGNATNTKHDDISGYLSSPRILPDNATTSALTYAAYDAFPSFLFNFHINASATIPLVSAYHAGQPRGTLNNAVLNNVGGLANVTKNASFYAEAIVGGTDAYGLYVQNAASGTARWNLYSNGTAGSAILGNLSVGTTTYPAGIGNLEVLANTSSTIAVGNATHAGCIVMGDTDAGGVSYLTTLNGVLSATSTKPTVCK